MTIVAGSILLPNPEVRKNEIITHKFRLKIFARFQYRWDMQPKLTQHFLLLMNYPLLKMPCGRNSRLHFTDRKDICADMC